MNADQPVRPANLENIVAINQGARDAGDAATVPTLSAGEVQSIVDAGGVVIDLRPQVAFGAAHIPGSLNLQVVSSEFEQRVGWVASDYEAFALIANNAEEVQAALYKLAFVGLSGRVRGWLDGGILGWTGAGRATRSTPQCTVHELRAALQANAGLRVLDVRDGGEYEAGHIPGATPLSFKELATRIESTPIDRNERIYSICKSGQRSSTAGSLLARAGYSDHVNVTGGMDAWKAAGFPIETDS